MSNKKYKKDWLDKRAKKLQNKKYHRKRRKYSYQISSIRNETPKENFIRKVNQSRKSVPNNFSFINNANQTIDFFYEIVSEIWQRKYQNNFFIDSANVTSVTVDALIYQIAIMQNIKINYEMKYTFRGNLPKDNQAGKIYKESGFMSYVESKIKKLPDSTNKMQIASGTRNDPKLASSLCQFVMKRLNKQMVDILSLQKVLIELMSNVYHHAYNNNEIMYNHWYVYAEYIDDYVRFVFVDTGAGIARTVRKNFLEKIQRLAKADASDSDLIYSTLMGDFRTETKEKHRGNGLSGVRLLAETELFRNFTVISGAGQCIIKNNKIVKNDYTNKIYGTIYIFDIV